MERRALLILIGVTAVLAAIWYLTPTETEPNDSQLLFPGLKDRLNEIESVTITVGGNRRVVTLARGAQQWTVEERSGYPADVGKIRQNLIALGDARIVEVKTSNPESYERLGIEDLDHTDATGHLMEINLAGKDGNETIGLIIGHTGVRGKTAYVRRPGQDRGLMITADFDPGREPPDWLARDLMDIPPSDIRAVTINHPDGEVVRIEKSSRSEPNFLVLDVPDGRELLYAAIANPVAGLLSGLEMDDVSPVDAIDKSVSRLTVTRFETFDGLVIEAKSYTTEDDTVVSFNVTADEPLAEQADELNSRLDSWVYSLPSYKSEQLRKRLNDFLKTDAE
jgi:hypothetical protein